MAAFLIAAVAWWPLDRWTFADAPAAAAGFGLLRAFVAGAHFVWLLVAALMPWVRRWPVEFGVPLGAVEPALAGAVFGTLGGLDAPWMHYGCFISLPTVLLVCGLGPPLLAAGGMAAAMFGGYLLAGGRSCRIRWGWRR